MQYLTWILGHSFGLSVQTQHQSFSILLDTSMEQGYAKLYVNPV